VHALHALSAVPAVKHEVVKMSPQCKGLEVLSFDVHNQKTVDRVVRQAKASAV
jgi:hypothetical protein